MEPREWVLRQLRRFRGLSQGKGNWDLLQKQILEKVDEATGDRTSRVVACLASQTKNPFDERKKWLSYCAGDTAAPVCQ